MLENYIDIFKKRKSLIIIFWSIATFIGFIHAWATRHYMNTDGVSYLDIADAYLRGDWNAAINAYWSPLYSWLLGLAMLALKPSPYWEYPVAHLVNFIIYLYALGCFHFFLISLVRYQNNYVDEFLREKTVALPEWAWLVLGYSLFIWHSLVMIKIELITPDMCNAAFMYLALGILLRICAGYNRWHTFVFLGIVLGLGCLTRIAMFPLAFILLGSSIFLFGNIRKALPRALIALVFFILIAGPFVFAISKSEGYVTFGTSGKIVYSIFVNRKNMWPPRQDEDQRTGLLQHPPTKIFQQPDAYQYGKPVKGTYPLWYNPSYWHRGLKIYFDFPEQLKNFAVAVRFYFHRFFYYQGYLLISVIILYIISRRRWLLVRDIAMQWLLFIPAIAGMLMYALVLLDGRYISPFMLFFWIGAFSSIRLPNSYESKRLISCIIISLLLVMMSAIGIITARILYYNACSLLYRQDRSDNWRWQIAKGLKQMGVKSGDKIAYIGNTKDASNWLRLARVKIIAEIFITEADIYSISQISSY